jgi:transcriptional regulator with XRE-family HTH domain
MSWLSRRPKATNAELIRELHELHSLAQQVFFRRQHVGLTQAELADKASMSQARIADLEAGHTNPTVKTLVRLSAALGCEVRDLLRPTSGEDTLGAVEEVERLRRELPPHFGKYAVHGRVHGAVAAGHHGTHTESSEWRVHERIALRDRDSQRVEAIASSGLALSA